MQHEVTDVQKLLDKQGYVVTPGWARRPVWQYNRENIAAPSFRIKEWDYYLAGNEHYAAAFTLSDLGYAGLISVSLIDLVERKEHTETILTAMPMGRLGLGRTSDDGNADFRNGRIHLRYTVKPHRRRIQCVFRDFQDGKTLTADLLMKQPEMDSICIATPWKENQKAFYYNQKVNCMPVKGKVNFDGRDYIFDGRKDMAVLDWGRGVWTYDNIWRWGTCSTRLNGVPFGFNLGYGFSDRSSATENVIFYNGRAHKLQEVVFMIGQDDKGNFNYMDPWTISSSDGRFEGIFEPILDRKAKIDMKVIASDQHQVFGHLTGTAVLDDGTELKMRDVIAAIEVVHNRY